MDWANLVLAAIAAISTPLTVWAITMQRRAENRDTELHDISWARRQGTNLSFTQTGTLPASEVTISLTGDGVTSVHRFSTVAPKEVVETPNKEHTRLLNLQKQRERELENAKKEQEQAEKEQREAEEERRKRFVGISIPSPTPGLVASARFSALSAANIPMRVDISAVISWRYPSNRSGRQELSWTTPY